MQLILNVDVLELMVRKSAVFESRGSWIVVHRNLRGLIDHEQHDLFDF